MPPKKSRIPISARSTSSSGNGAGVLNETIQGVHAYESDGAMEVSHQVEVLLNQKEASGAVEPSLCKNKQSAIVGILYLTLQLCTVRN